MNEIKRDDITVDVFSHICRICLQTNDKMEDIFGIGFHNQITEFTNLKVEKNDKLPQLICSNCRTQSEEVFKFLQQAKSADDHLRSLLANTLESDYKSGDEEGEEEDDDDDDDDDERDYKRKSPRKRVRKWSKSKTNKKLKPDYKRDKMYLIYVPKPEESGSKPDMEILIQDLSSENAELSHYCKALVKGNLSDHTYPKEMQSKDYTPHAVNLDVFTCDECRLAFEELNDLTNHVLVHDGKQPLQVDCYYYNCPVCGASERDKSEFLNHLEKHKQEGIFFVKVNSMGERVKVKDEEKHVFTVVNNCKVFLVNLTSGFCSFCCRDVEKGDGFLKHLGGCASGEGSIQYTCPVCSCTFTDDEETFGRHLKVHQQTESCFFIKVDKTGQAVELDDGDDVFVQFTEAMEVVSKTEGVFKIVDVNSCEWCGFMGEGLMKIQEHCEVVHGKTLGGICCPVCMEVFNTDDNFYEHLRRHKQDGVGFVLVRRDNEMGVLREDCVDLFTQSKVLWSAASFGVSQASCIELVGKNSEYTCDLCKMQFKKKKEVVMHLKSHQSPQECVICEKCGKECTGRGSYRKHFLQHSKGVGGTSKRPTCGICNKTFANRTTLNGHIKHHMREGTGNEMEVGMMCEKCGKSFSNNASLTKHKKLHMRDKENAVLKCEICDRDFFRQSSFDRHKSAHLNPKYLECDVCKMPLSSVASLQKHLESHRNGSNTFDCRACKLSFLTKDSLTAHQTHTGHYLDRKPLECNVCHEKFFIGRKFTEHIKTHPKYKMGECSLCGKRLSTIQSLMLHMGRHFESNSILCPHCGKQFFEERNYHRHLLTHEGIKPFPCDVLDCKKSFYTLFELNRHKKYHNNTRDFRCPYCSKSFHEANHLTVHVRTHTGERPYTCPHCRKGFVTRTRCKHHIKLVHQGIGYDLIQSNISKKVTVFEAVKTVI